MLTMESRYPNDDEEQDIDYGYEEATPSSPLSCCNLKVAPRRCSLKTSERYTPRQKLRRSTIAAEQPAVILGDNTSVKRRTSISFQEKDEIKEVEPLLALTDEQLWTTPADYLRAKEEAVRLIRHHHLHHQCLGGSSPNVEEEHACTRGFEQYLNGNRGYKHSSRQSRNLVLQVQRSQKTAGLPCEETLSQLYARFTLESARRARQLGARDFAEVKHEHRMTKRSMNRKCSRRLSM